jgi:hypothetical protein
VICIWCREGTSQDISDAFRLGAEIETHLFGINESIAAFCFLVVGEKLLHLRQKELKASHRRYSKLPAGTGIAENKEVLQL